jgi:anti-sigma regulatory factor (Ser/Thr protein kinase)
MSSTDGGGLKHAMVSYRDRASYRAEVLRFAHAGLSAAQPVFLALPGGETQDLAGRLSRTDRQAAELMCFDMMQLGRNPARVIPALRAFADRHQGQRIRIIQEPVWPGRSAAETRESIRSEALLNLALAGVAADALCLFDETALPPLVMAAAECTHPQLLRGAEHSLSLRAGCADVPWEFPAGFDDPLPPLPADAETLSYSGDLAPARKLVEGRARSAGIGPLQAMDLVLAVSEVAANTLSHTASGGTLAVWQDEREMLCQADDSGWITDPLAGRVSRPPDSRGHGLLVVNQLCDLVELRSSQSGTTIRMHLRLPGPSRVPGSRRICAEGL